MTDLLANSTGNQINLVFGVILSEPKYFEGLTSELIEFNKTMGGISALVVSDNAGLPREIVFENSKRLALAGIQLTVISLDEAMRVADSGILGYYYIDKRNRIGISFGRTVLHRYTYLECLKYTNPVAWIIDDDVSLKDIYWGTLDFKITGKELLGHISRWKKNGIGIVVGKVGGDPPVPIMATARTQMLDLYYNLRVMIEGNQIFRKENELMERDNIMKECPAYFYDFPEKSFRHLETPIWRDLHNTSLYEFSKEAGTILKKAVFRKASYPSNEEGDAEVFYYQDTETFGPIRGGNTIILDLDCLRDFVNSSPRSGDIPYRRGDTLWVILNKRLGSRRQYKGTRTVISSQMMLIQDRRENETDWEMQKKLISDTLGSALVRSLDSFLFENRKGSEARDDYYKPIKFTDRDVKNILNAMEVEIDKRVRQILLNAWRIRGLAQSIKSILTRITGSSPGALTDMEALTGIAKLCERMEKLFSENEINELISKIKNFKRDDAINFLLNLSQSSEQFSENLPIQYTEEDITALKLKINRVFHSEELQAIGKGMEGIVFSDGINAYKCFHYGKFSMDKSALEFLQDKLIANELNGIANLYSIYASEGYLIFKEEYVNGKTYHGGKVKEWISLLEECRATGIVIKNIAPKNLLDNGKEIKFIDLGRDLEPFTEQGFMKMCRKAYLTFRWHFRPDIYELLHRSNSELDLPELFGFEYFFSLLQKRHTGEISIPFVLRAFTDYRDKKILDYGCGKGEIADELSKKNDVSVYDIDLSGYYSRHSTSTSTVVMDRDGLNRVSMQIERFDVVLLSLILCTVNDADTREILKDSRKVLNDDGEIVVVICNPFNIENRETQTHEKIGCSGTYNDLFEFEKRMKISGNLRHEYHRPIDWYIRELKRTGFMPVEFYESDGGSLDSISPGSEFLMIRAQAVTYSENSDVALMIKASSMEWRTIGFNVKHIVKQLEGPEKFSKKFIITDHEARNFARQYDTADIKTFDLELKKLLDQGVVDSVVYASEDIPTKESISERWFGIRCAETRCANGQPVLTTLQGFEQIGSRYVLQIDSDCIIYRDGTEKSYLKEMVNVLKDHEDAVTVSFPISNLDKKPFTQGGGSKKWRTEVRNCLIDMERLISLRPLPNSLTENGTLELPWHRSLDRKLSSGPWDSYRGSTGNACFIHVPNFMKRNVNFWYGAVKYYEESSPRNSQAGLVDLQAAEICDVQESRQEDMIVIVKGGNVPIPKIRRCFRSLLDQNFQDFGVIYIDVASENGSDDYVQFIGKKMFSGRMTLFRNYVPMHSTENISVAVRGICRNPQSIIVLLDADDALIGKDALSKVKKRYSNGADLTVGTMIRTDKFKKYPVDFRNPRIKRGGNVWQHLRTFRKYLFDSISPDDLKIDGEWITEADDWAYMIPMVEMAENPEVIEDIVYFYEPSPDKSKRDKKKYENTIAKIVAKASYLRKTDR